MKTIVLVSAVLLAAIAWFVRPIGHVPGHPALIVSAAASLEDALEEINTAYTRQQHEVGIVTNFASSGTIQKQIENGAPVDVFISAAPAQMDALEKQGLISPYTRRNLLGNSVVLIVPRNSALGLTSLSDLTRDGVKRIAIGDPGSVPAGRYGREALDELGIADGISSKLVLAGDVRQVLSYVASGTVDAGIVYATDAQSAPKVKVVAVAPEDINARVIYPVAVIKATDQMSAAQDYVGFLFGPQARELFKAFGFTIVPNRDP